MKRSSSFKPISDDLASVALSSTLSTQLDLSNNNSNNNNTLANAKLKSNSDIGASIGSNETLSTVNNFCFNNKSTTSSSSSYISNINSNSKTHLCLSMPLAKPHLNELKPQLSIDSKMKTKSLIERRGSSNSLTLTLNPSKKKLQITNPSKECTTIEYLSKQSNLLQINELIDISKNTNLYNEFYFLPFNHSESCVPCSGIKNRYKAIVPNETTRVNLPMINNDPLSSYINANYINGYKCESKAYIATQGPMSNTLGDFWRMVWNEGVSCIVMITKLVERNKNKCELYFPDEQDIPIQYDDTVVTVKHINYFQDYEVRQIAIVNNNETRILNHYWYTAWPDHNLPENPTALLELIKIIDCDRRYNDGLVKGPVVVHCSAGVGRTGCFLALSIGIKQIDLNNLVDIVKIVCNLRIDRGGMIQTLEQYEFIYQVLAYYCVYYKKFSFGSNLSMSSSSAVPSSPPLNCLRSPTLSSTFSFNTQ